MSSKIKRDPSGFCKTTKTERRHKLNKIQDQLHSWFGPAKVHVGPSVFNEELLECSDCHKSTGMMYMKNGKIYCYYCYKYIDGEVEKEISNMKEA